MPILLGVLPFGLIFGALALEAGLQPIAAQAMSSIVFAGSAQFISTQLFAEGAPGLVIILTVAVVNLRHVLYSASLAPYIQHLSDRWKWLLAYLLTDEAYAVTVIHYSETSQLQTIDSENQSDPAGEIAVLGDQRHWFFLGAGLALWATWQLSTAAGIFLGAIIPAGWSLDFAVALTFLALMAPVVKDRPSLAAAFSAGVTAVLTFYLPYKLGLVLAALVGISVGAWLEGRR